MKRRWSADMPPLLSGNEKGMTLLEVLLATLILAMVVSMVTLSLSGSLTSLESTLDQEDLSRRAAIAFGRIGEDLAGTLPIDGVPFLGEKIELNGQRADTLRFASHAHVVFAPNQESQGMGRIVYRVEAGEEESRPLILYRQDTLMLGEEQAGQEEDDDLGLILCDQLRSVIFSYINREGEAQENWRSSPEDDGQSNSSVQLPVAVRVRLEFWVDLEKEKSLTFETSFLLPAGTVRAKELEK